MKNFIGENLRRIRVSKGISRVKLVELMEGKVCRNTVFYIEKGITTPRNNTLKIIADALDVSMDELTGNVSYDTYEMLSNIMSRLDDIEMKLDKLISDKEVESNE